MAERGQLVNKRPDGSTQRGSIGPPPSSPSSDEQNWYSINQSNCSVRYRDQDNNLPGFRYLQPTDVILLLTPLVPPRPNTSNDEIEYDPYEYLGKALLSRHQNFQRGRYIRKDGLGEDLGDGRGEDLGGDLEGDLRFQRQKGEGAVAHVSYTNKNTISSIHRGFMRLAKFVILVVNNNFEETHPHVHAANIALAVNNLQCGDKRGIPLVLTNNTPGAFDLYRHFPTVIQTEDYSKKSLDAIAGIIFGEIRAGTESPNPGPPTA